MGSKPMEFSQSEREMLVMSLNSRESKILDAMEQRLDQIVNEKHSARVEKMLRSMFNDWHTLHETRQLKERIHRSIDQDGHIKAVQK